MGFDIETRVAGTTQASGKRLSGYAAVFNTETVIAGAFRETIAPGAFAQAITGDVLALMDHSYGRVIGRTTSGTLRLSEDRHGLKVDIDPPDAPDGQTALALVSRGDLAGMSFGFIVRRESWQESAVGLPLRTLEDIELIECSIVALPAYPTTTIAAVERARGIGAADAARRRMRMKAAGRRLVV